MTNKKQIFFRLALILCIFLLISGCTIPKNNLSMNTTTPTPTFIVLPTISNDPANVSPTVTDPFNITAGISVFSDKPVYKVGEENDITFWITNNLEVPLLFGMGKPLRIEYYMGNGTWKDLGGGGGTQAFWYLQTGESHTFPPTGVGGSKAILGIYRIHIFGEIESKNPESFEVQKEFIFE